MPKEVTEKTSDQMMTIQQVMKRLQVSDETVYRYIRSGKLKAKRVGGLWRINPDDLDNFVSSSTSSERSVPAAS